MFNSNKVQMFQANEINKIIHQLTNTFKYTDVRKEVKDFLMTREIQMK